MEIYQNDSTVSFDIIELPSRGKLYPGNEKTVRIEHMTAADENVLTSPNLYANGMVYEILLQRKIKDAKVRVNEMLLGDQNAILIFLRATSYGHLYPITVNDPITGKPFDTDVDLTQLNIKYLDAEPDENMEFEYKLPKSGQTVKFKLLNAREFDEVRKKDEERQRKFGVIESTFLTMRLEAMIQSVDGNRDRVFIAQYVPRMVALDSLKLRQYIASIEPNVDLTTEVVTPSGQTIKVQVPIDASNFFWIGA